MPCTIVMPVSRRPLSTFRFPRPAPADKACAGAGGCHHRGARQFCYVYRSLRFGASPGGALWCGGRMRAGGHVIGIGRACGAVRALWGDMPPAPELSVAPAGKGRRADVSLQRAAGGLAFCRLATAPERATDDKPQSDDAAADAAPPCPLCHPGTGAPTADQASR